MDNQLKIHHIGYLVKKMDRAIKAFTDIGYEVESETVYDEYRGVDICFLLKDGYRIELVSPKTKDSVVYSLMKKYGNSPYHICYTCEDMNGEIVELSGKGYVVYDKPHEAVAFDNHYVCFLIHPYLGMIELLEEI